MKPPSNEISAQEEVVCQEFVLNNGNQSAAYRKGYPKSKKWKPETVYVKASHLFKLDKIKARVNELREAAAKIADEKFQVDAEYVLRRHVEIDQMDVADILDDDGSTKPIKEWPLVWRNFVCGIDLSELFEGRGDVRERIGILKKIKWPDKVKNLQLLGSHVGVNAYKHITELRGPRGGPVEIITTKMTPQEASDLYADTLNDR